MKIENLGVTLSGHYAKSSGWIWLQFCINMSYIFKNDISNLNKNRIQENFSTIDSATREFRVRDTASSAYSAFMRMVTSRRFRSLGNVTVYVTIGYAFISYALDS